MRLKLWTMLLTASTVFVPAHAHAGIIEFAFVAFTASLQGAIGVTAAGFLIGAAKIAAGAALSALVGQVLTSRQQRSRTAPPQELLSNFAQEIPDRFMAIGVTRIGGALILGEQKSGQLSKLIAHCDSEATEEIALYLNDIAVTLDGSGFVTNEEFLLDDGTKCIQLETRAGTPTQAAMATLISRFDEWSVAHRGAGIADTLMTIRALSQDNGDRNQIYRHRGVLGLGEPDTSRVARWSRVYDPRLDSTRSFGSGPQRVDDETTWGPATGNLALAIAYHRMHPERFAMDPEDIWWENIAEQADICDLEVIDRYGQTLPKYHGAIIINKNQDDNITAENTLLAACDGIRVEDEDGRFGIRVGHYYEPELVLTDADVLEIASSESDDGERVFTHLYAKYTEPEFAYKAASTAPYINTDIWSEGDRVTSREIEVYEAQHHNHGVRLLKAAAKQTAAPFTLQVLAGLRAKRARSERFLRLALADTTLSGVYQIQTLERGTDRVTVPLTLIKVTSDWWSLEEGEEGARPNFTTAIEVDAEIINIPDEDMVIVPEPIANSAGAGVRLAATFPVPTRADRKVEIQHRQQGETVWQNFAVKTEDGSGASGPVNDGTTQEVRWRVVALSGRSSGYSDIRDLGAVADTVAPAALVSFTVAGNLGRAAVTLTTPNDPKFQKVEIYRVAAGAAFDPDVETPVVTLAVSPSSTFGYTDGDATRVNLFANPGFDSDTAWSKGAGWTIGGGKATHAAGSANSLLQSVALTAGQVYRYSMTVLDLTAGSVFARFNGGTVVNGTARTANGTYRGSMTAVSGNNAAGFNESSTFAGSVDDAVLYPQTSSCAPQGVWDYYAIPLNGSNVAGPTSGPTPATII